LLKSLLAQTGCFWSWWRRPGAVVSGMPGANVVEVEVIHAKQSDAILIL